MNQLIKIVVIQFILIILGLIIFQPLPRMGIFKIIFIPLIIIFTLIVFYVLYKKNNKINLPVLVNLVVGPLIFVLLLKIWANYSDQILSNKYYFESQMEKNEIWINRKDNFYLVFNSNDPNIPKGDAIEIGHVQYSNDSILFGGLNFDSDFTYDQEGQEEKTGFNCKFFIVNDILFDFPNKGDKRKIITNK